MKRLQVLAVGNPEADVLDRLVVRLANHFGVACELMVQTLDPNFAFHTERGQFHSSELLAEVQNHVNDGTWRLLAVTDVDLYIPILTFVFGEAQVRGRCALISMYRLRQEFYGLPASPDLLEDRILKEAVHELGHTLDLTHCRDYSCAMAPSHAVEWIDLKQNAFCTSCGMRVLAAIRGASAPQQIR